MTIVRKGYIQPGNSMTASASVDVKHIVQNV